MEAEARGKKGKKAGATTVKEKICYAMGDMGCNFVWSFVSGFLMLYYTDSVGVSAAFIGTMMLIARFLDGTSDIAMGVVIEKTNTRWGKARPWLLFACVPFTVSLILLFHVPESMTVTGKQIYIYATYIFMAVICYTAVNLSYNAMLPRFSLTPDDRNVVSAVKGIGVIIAALFIAVGTPVFLEAFGGSKNQGAWSKISMLYAGIGLVCILTAFLGVKEKISARKTKAEKEEKMPIAEALKILVINKYFYIATLLFVIFYVNTGLGGVGIFYARDVIGDANSYGLMSVIMMVPMLIGTPIMPALYRKFGKRNVMMCGALLSAAAGALQWMQPANLSLFLVFSAVKGFGSIMLSASIFTLASDIVEYTEWKNHVRAEGLVTSANSFGIKVGTGLGSGLVGWVLAFGKYDAALTVQPQSALNAMIALQIVIPLVLSILAAVLLAFWDLEKYHPQIEAALQGEVREK